MLAAIESKLIGAEVHDKVVFANVIQAVEAATYRIVGCCLYLFRLVD